MDRQIIRLKNHCFLLLFGLIGLSEIMAQPSQNLSLSTAYQMAEANYPLMGNQPLLLQSSDLRVQNLEKSKLPAVNWKALGSLQTEAPSVGGEGLPISVDLPLYNFRTYAEANYLLLDGGVNDARQELEKLQLIVEQQALQVELDGLKPQVNAAFFAVLLLRQQLDLLDVTQQDLAQKRLTLEAGVRHGAVLESEVDKIAVRQLEIQSEQEQLQSDIDGMISVLENLTGTDLPPEVGLLLPSFSDFQWNPPIRRPEQQLFKVQKTALLANESLIEASRKPTLSAFANAGVGYPNPLNFFDNSISPYAIGGLNFSWKIFDWGQAERDRELLTVQAQMIDNQRETFEYKVDLQNEKYQNEITKLEQQIVRDQEVADLQGKILRQLSSQLEHGVIMVNEYVSQSNAELRARQQLRLHEVQLQQVKVEYLTMRGVF